MCTHTRRLTTALFLFALTGTFAHAQEFRATLEGEVLSGVKSPVVHAHVQAVQQDTGAKTNSVTDAQGRFSIPSLTPGVYQLILRADGFRSYIRQGITLDPGSHVALNVHLTPGPASETIVESRDAAMTSGRIASTDQVIGTQAVRDLPLNGGTPSTLSQLAAGMAKTDAPGETRPFDNSSNGTVAGTPTGSTEVELDGSANIDWKFRTTYNPPSDVVGQVKTTVFQPDAAYGHSGGGFVNMTTRGGANKFHGDAYEFNQVSYFRANSYFNNLNGLKRPVTNYNQYGLTFSGPILIPHVFDGRNKLLWEFAWQGIRDTSPASGSISVPTDREKNGDFGDISGLTLYNPYGYSGTGTRAPITGNCLFAASTCTGTPLINETLQQYNPIAYTLMQYYPSGVTKSGSLNYPIDPVSPDYFDSEFTRFDYLPSTQDKMFVKFWHNQRLQKGNNFLGNIATGLNLDRENWGATIDEVHTLNASTIFNVRVNWMRFVETQSPTSAGMNPAKFGFQSLATTYNAMPLIKFTGKGTSGSCTTSSGNQISPGNGFQCLGSGSNASAGQNAFDSYHIFSDVSHKAGAHNLKAGVDVRQNRRFTTNWQNSDGLYTFGTDYTVAAPNSKYTGSKAAWGNDLAEMELGIPSSGEFDTNSFSATRLGYFALFLQDDYKLAHNLVVNMGVRFEHDTPLTERANRSTSGFDTTAPHSFTKDAIAAFNTIESGTTPYAVTPSSSFNPVGGLTFASANNRSVYQTPSKIFSPRVGVSWKPDHLKGTTIQAGFGIYVFPIAPIADPTLNGYSSATTYVPSQDGAFYTPPTSIWTNAFPYGLTAPTGSSAGADTFVGKTIAFLAPQQRDGYSERWQFQIQHQITPNDLVQVNYLGNHAVRIQVTDNYLNAIPKQYRATLAQQAVLNNNTSVSNPFYGLLPGTTTLGQKNVGLSQLLAPYPEFPSGSGVDEEDLNAGNSHFHSLNARYDHRMAKGFSITSNFSWSKLIEGLSYLDNADTRFERRISTIDYPFHLSATGVYRLPFGKGQLFVPSNKIARRAAEEWTLTMGYSMQSGAPVKWSTTYIYDGGDIHWNAKNHSAAFDTSHFTNPAYASYYIRTFPTTNTHWRQDGLNEWNTSLLKNIALVGSLKFQFRAEAFNVFNHVTYSAPNIGTSGFGTITSQYNTPRSMQFGGKLNF
jgi:hypothetical protein